MHLLSHVADQLWLVNEGRVSRYEGDLDAYRRMLLDQPVQVSKKPKPKPVKPSRARIVELRQAMSEAEARVAKLTDIRERLAGKLSNPSLYSSARAADTEIWQKKFSEVEEGLERAEALWLRAVSRFEDAKN